MTGRMAYPLQGGVLAYSDEDAAVKAAPKFLDWPSPGATPIRFPHQRQIGGQLLLTGRCTQNLRLGHFECYGNASPIDQRIARMEITSLLRVYVNEPPAPASRSGRIEKVIGNRRAFGRTAPGPSGYVLASRGRVIALGVLHGCSVDPIRLVQARRRRPRESAGGGNKANLPGLGSDRSPSQRHEAGRRICRVRRVDRIYRCREQFHRHGKSVRQL